MSVKPIYVAGLSRAGTTLTTEILGRNSQISARGAIGLQRDIDELRVSLGAGLLPATARDAVRDRVRAFYARRPNAAAQAHMDDLIGRTDLAAKLLAAHDYGEMSRMFLDAEAAFGGQTRWVQHNTGSLYNLAGVFARLPDVKVILCVRHPLDYLVSYRDSFRRAERRSRQRDEVERLRKLYHPVMTSLLWRSGVRSARKALRRYGERVLLSRYEDLVADPEAGVRRLCAFVECDFEPAMLKVEKNNSSETVTQSGIFASSVGRWKNGLTAAEAFIAQRICRREMRRLGYDLEPVRPDIADVAWHLLTTPLFVGRALLANRTRSGSRLRPVSRRVSALVRG